MEYAALVDVYDRLAATDSNNEKRDILAGVFADAGAMLPRLVTLVRGRLSPAYDRTELGVSSSLTLDAMVRASGASENAVRDRWKETGDLGDAAAWAVDNGGQQTLVSSTLTVERVHDDLRDLATYRGSGSQDRKVDTLAGLLSDADANEARYVVRTALGHMRVGVGEGTIRDAVAHAFLDGSTAAVDAVERAVQVTTDFRVVARTARDEGVDGLQALDVELFRPVQVMLAEKAESLTAGLADAADGRALCEYKYDGVRVQIHVDGGDVGLFTRRLQDVTEQFPDVVRAVRESVGVEQAVLDGELVGYTPETVATEAREPVAFQDLSQRVKRESDIEAMAREVPVVVHLFDCLADGETLLDRPLSARLDRLDAAFDPVAPDPDPDAPGAGVERAEFVWVESPVESAEQLYREALDSGHEGLMIKNPDATYQPGRRVGRLLKHKPTMEPLDLVVTRATYSEGRRSEWLGRLSLGAYDPSTDAFREVGRLSTGYTDEELAALTERLEAAVTARDGRDVALRPTVVLEVEYEEVQASSEYDSGYALRFPRFLGVREDLDPTGADTVERVGKLYDSQ